MLKKNWSTLWCDGGPGAGAVAVVTLCALLHGCGYRFAVDGPGPRIGGGAVAAGEAAPVRLVIREFRNRTFHHRLAFACTGYVRQEFAVGGGAVLTAEAARADYVMTGEIVSVSVPPLTFSTSETREQRVHVVVRATVKRRRTGETVWTETAAGAGDFFVNRAPGAGDGRDEIQFNQVLRERAMEQAGQDAAAHLAAAFWSARVRGMFAPVPVSPQQSSAVPPRRERATEPAAPRGGRTEGRA